MNKLKDAREEVITACKRALDMGLLVRTWGNVSSRVGEDRFVITPSGRNYTELKHGDIPIVNLRDGAFWGDIMPSMEKELHRKAYIRDEEINFIIHTHQQEASVLSALGMNVPLGGGDENLPEEIPCADYGFPGSDELAENVESCLKNNPRAVLMANHGAVFTGKSQAEALNMAASVEMYASNIIRTAFEAYVGRPMTVNDSVYTTVLKALGFEMVESVRPFVRSERKDGEVIFYDHDGGPLEEDDTLSFDQKIHLAIYEARPDINGIVHALSPSLVAYSVLKHSMAAYLDDFAQINGVTMEGAPVYNEDEIAEALSSNHGVMLWENGALCCGTDIYNAEALAIVAEKNARCFLIGQLFKGYNLNKVPMKEAAAMREFYLEKYSKRF